MKGLWNSSGGGSMLDILDIETAVPAKSISVSAACDELTLSNKDKRMYERFFGLARIPSDPDLPLNAMTAGAVTRLLQGPTPPDIVVHCHTLLSSGPFRGDSAIPVQLFRPGKTEVFSATMCHCASGVAVLEMVDALLPPDGTALCLEDVRKRILQGGRERSERFLAEVVVPEEILEVRHGVGGVTS